MVAFLSAEHVWYQIILLYFSAVFEQLAEVITWLQVGDSETNEPWNASDVLTIKHCFWEE